MRWIRNMYDWGIRWSARPRALSMLSGLAFCESVFFPVPPDVLLIPMCLARRVRAFWYACVCTVSSVLGGVLGYFLGFVLWESIKFFFYEYVPGFTYDRFVLMGDFYERYNFWVVFTAGFTPLPYKVITLTAGIFHVHFLWFFIASLVGRSGRFFLISVLIYFFGEWITSFIDRYFNWLTVLATVCVFIVYVLYHMF